MAINKFSRVYLVGAAQSVLTFPPAGLAFMAGVCEKINLEYQAVDLNAEFLTRANQDTWDQVFLHVTMEKKLEELAPDLLSQVDNFIDSVISDICKYSPDCVAMTLLTYVQQYWTDRFLSRLRPAFAGTIIIGGPGVSVPGVLEKSSNPTYGEDLVKKQLIDYYVLGEGDFILEEFFQGNRLLPGLNHAQVHNIWQPQLDDLDNFSTPSYKQISFDAYNIQDDKKHLISVTGSRGCVRRCSFCDVGHIWKKYRYRSGENISNEILKHHYDTGVSNFWFTDSLINGSLKQLNDLMTHLARHRQTIDSLKDLQYNGQFIIRPRSDHPEKMFRLLSESGCNRLSIGIESGSESVRNHMGKKFSNEDIDWHFEMCEKYKIKNWILLISGYPTETEQDHQATMDMLTRNQKYVLNHTILGLNLQHLMAVLPNTPVSTMSELGIHFIDNPQGAVYGSYFNWLAESNPSLTLNRRYQRFAELAEWGIKLRYNLPTEILYFMANKMNHDGNEINMSVMSDSAIMS